MDFEALLSQKLLPGHKLIAVAEAGLVQEFVQTPRLVALIEGFETETVSSGSPSLPSVGVTDSAAGDVERALLVLCRTKPSPNCAADLSVETVLPIDARFQYNIDGHSAYNPHSIPAGSDVLLLSLCSARHKLLLEMSFGERTNTFVSEVLRAAEGVSKRKAPTPEFTWLKPYLAGGNDSSSSSSTSSGAKQPGAGGGGMASETSSVGSGGGIFTIDSGSSNFLQSLDWSTGSNASGSPRLQTKQQATRAAPESSGGGAALSSNDVNLLRLDGLSLREESADSSTFYEASPAPIAARESHVRHQMSLRESSYTHSTTLTVFVGTYNVNGGLPSVGLADWLASDTDPPDVYALGFQELDLATEAYIFTSSAKEAEWRSAVLSGVHPAAQYQVVTCVRLVGVMLLVLVQRKHAKHVTNVQTCVVPCGIMHMLGNKGGVSTRLNLYNTSICFVNCHLAAHVEEYERRNEDYDCICEKTFFSDGATSPLGSKYIKDHNHIFFFGDMNYRIPPKDLDVRHLASTHKWDTLLSLDQLNLQRKVGRVFKGYQEGRITFQPTFKYDVGTDNWDSEKGRAPAWCDRILWAGEGIEQKVYRSHMNLKISDHKPVSAVFQSQVKVVDVAKYRSVHEEVMKQLDKLENEYLPQVSLSSTELILQPVHFLEPQKVSLTVSNTGQIPVQFRFIKKLNDQACCKPWLKIHPMSAFIIPGADCEVNLEVKVDKSSASLLNSGQEKLYDILVLHLEGGKDFFITITGDYMRSCFGTSINALVHMNKPFSEVPVAQLIDLESSAPKNGLELPYAIPKELWYLVDHLHGHGLQVEGLFCTQGLTKEILEIRACLDAGAPSRTLPGSVHSAAEALMLLLEALPEPVVPFKQYQSALLAATVGFAASKQVLDAMPDYHRNVFSYLVAFLKELLAHSDQNKLDANTLAMVFGLILLREPPSTKKVAAAKPDESKAKRQMFVRYFLENEF